MFPDYITTQSLSHPQTLSLNTGSETQSESSELIVKTTLLAAGIFTICYLAKQPSIRSIYNDLLAKGAEYKQRLYRFAIPYWIASNIDENILIWEKSLENEPEPNNTLEKSKDFLLTRNPLSHTKAAAKTLVNDLFTAQLSSVVGTIETVHFFV